MALADKLSGQESRASQISDIQTELKTVINDLVQISPSIRVYLFGSYAKGTARQISDIDIAVILPDAIDKKIFRKQFYSHRVRIQIPVDFIFRNESEFQSLRADYPVDEEIKTTGVEMYPQWSLHDEV